jgi:hypothetical protein
MQSIPNNFCTSTDRPPVGEVRVAPSAQSGGCHLRLSQQEVGRMLFLASAIAYRGVEDHVMHYRRF